VRGYKGFDGMRLGCREAGRPSFIPFRSPNGPPARKKRRAAAGYAQVAFQKGYAEEFREVVEGGLPEGWEGDDAISVLRQDRPRLEVWDKNAHTVTLPPLAIRGNFYLEWEAVLAWEVQSLDVKLLGADGAPDLTVVAVATGGGTGSRRTFRSAWPTRSRRPARNPRPRGEFPVAPRARRGCVPGKGERRDRAYPAIGRVRGF